MSATAPGAAWQRPDVVASFLERRRRVLPLLEVQEDLLVRVLHRHGRPLQRLLDLGSGDGATGELLLGEWPEANAVLFDNSRAMLERADTRLARFQGRWTAVEGDLSQPGWQDALPEQSGRGGYDAVVSSYAIHHLESADKRKLFQTVLALLEPGGMFLNMDFVAAPGPLEGIFEEQMKVNFLRAERERGGHRSEDEIARELSQAFDADEEDRPDRAEDQVSWLNDVGFEQAQIHFKWGEVAVYGAAKPVI